jgi:hypothetical protein
MVTVIAASATTRIATIVITAIVETRSTARATILKFDLCHDEYSVHVVISFYLHQVTPGN